MMHEKERRKEGEKGRKKGKNGKKWKGEALQNKLVHIM